MQQFNEEATWGNRLDAENTMGRAFKQQGNSKENVSKKEA